MRKKNSVLWIEVILVPDGLRKKKLHLCADLTKGSFGHFSSFYVIKISKTPKISIFCMFLQVSQIASDMLYNQGRKHF